jgi:hypothetical protein
MSKAENCMFLRECVCLRPTNGVCNKCGEKTKYSEQEKCWYCDCDCKSKNCTLDRNPTKKYFKVESTEDLFNKFKKLGYGVTNLAAIVQNDMIIDMEELKDWLATAGEIQQELSSLIKETTTEILKKQVKK